MTLLLWAALLTMSWHFYRRCVSLQRQITEIVRHDALRHAQPVEAKAEILGEEVSAIPFEVPRQDANPAEVARTKAA